MSFQVRIIFYSLLFFLWAPLNVGAQVRGLEPSKEPSPVLTGKVYALVVGASEYSLLPSLRYADDDACLFKQYLQSEAGGSVPDSAIYEFTNKNATSDNIWKVIDTLTQIAQKGDIVYLYFAGHGSATKSNYYLLQTNCASEKSPAILNGTDAVNVSNLRNHIKEEFAEGVKVIFIADACRTTEIRGAQRALELNSSFLENNGIGFLTLLSASQGQPSLEGAKYGGGHGLYTYYLVKGLTGAADVDQDQAVTVGEINRYVKDKVYQYSDQMQDPNYCCPNRERVVLSQVDTTFLFNRGDCENQVDLTGTYGFRGLLPVDTTGTYWLQQLQVAVSNYRFKGEKGANSLLDSLERCCAGSARMKQARDVLLLGYLRFGQELINLYLLGMDSKAFTRSLLNPGKERLIIRQQLRERETALSKKIKKYGKRKRKKIKLEVAGWKVEQQRLAQLLQHSDSLDAQANNRLEQLQAANYEEAAAWMRKALSWVGPKSVLNQVHEPRIRFLDLYAAQGRSADTLQLLTLLDTLLAHDSTAFVLNLAGKTWTYLGVYDQAEGALLRAVEEADDWAYPYNNLGELMDVQDRYPEAEGWYRQAIALDSSFVYADNNLALNLERQGRWEEAEVVYEAAIQKDGKYAMTYNNLGQLYWSQGDTARAMDYFTKAVEFNPRHPFSTENLLNRYLEEEDLQEVEALGERARQLREDTDLVSSSSYSPAKERREVEIVKGKRLALVVGNWDYPGEARLRTPGADADLMEEALKELGFEVIKLHNAGYEALQRSQDQFAARLATGEYEAALYYFAGHGVEVDGVNYLLPVDAQTHDAEGIRKSCMSAEQALLQLTVAPETVKLLLLDACYVNPLVKKWHPRGDDGGLEKMPPPYKTVVGIANEKRKGLIQLVLDPNNAFAKYLASNLLAPNISVGAALDSVKNQARRLAASERYKQSQFPYFEKNGVEAFTFRGTVKPGSTLKQVIYAPTESYIDPLVGRMIKVEGGRFQMGCTEEQEDCESYEKPVHWVTLGDYFLGETEVTQAQWRAVMGDNPSRFSGCDQCPVEQVSWEDIQEYLKKLNSLVGAGTYRLPTEAEWEYAARGGKESRGYQYSGSNNLKEVGWYESNSGNKTHPVKGKRPNELGLYDMSGNVWEWCSDRYGNYYSSAQTNPVGAASGSDRVLRGGSWNFLAADCRVAYRGYSTPDNRGNFLGFRLARTH